MSQGISTTRIRAFRGMHGDRVTEIEDGVPVATGRRNIQVPVQTLDGQVMVDDAHVLTGRTIEEAQLGTLDGVADVALQTSFYSYEVRQTADPIAGHERDTPLWAEVGSTIERIAVTPTTFRERGTRTTYNSSLQPASTEELGWLGAGVTGDERCSLTTYAENPDAGMFVYPSTNRTLAGTCDAPGPELSVSRTYYDGSTTLGAPPTRGNVTRQEARVDAGDPGRWAVTATTFDALGRPTEVIDPRGSGTTTTYTASPAHAIPTQVAVSNDLGQTTTTSYLPQYSVPLSVDGPNASDLTSYLYDALGRTIRVRLPTEQPQEPGKEFSLMFGYQLSLDETTGGAGTAPPIVRSRQLTSQATSGSGVRWEDSWVVYDGNLRERQTQIPSPTAGQVLVVDTAYDGRGLLRDEGLPEAVAGSPGQGILAPATWANRTRHLYDELGRATEDQWLRGDTEHHDTTYEYDEDTVTVTGPGADSEQSVVASTVDGLGRTVEIRELDSVDSEGTETWATTTYGYDLADNLTSITDAEGHQITYSYNMAGWRTAQTDPNRGSASFGYDVAGSQVMAQDATGQQVWTSYDDLGRPVDRRSDSAGGPLLASWSYDTAPGGVGQMDRSVRHTAGGSWVSEVVGYDGRGRVTGTTLTVPAGVAGLSGTHRVDQAYDRADRPTVTTFPDSVGGLPAETVATAYNGFGLPATLTGAQSYVRATVYDSRARMSSLVVGPPNPGVGSNVWQATNWSYDEDQELESVLTVNSGTSGTFQDVSRHEVSYDDAGRVAGRTAEVSGLGSWRECYGYDRRSRLGSAFTVGLSSTCGAGAPGGGDQPFEQAFAYSAGNAIEERTDDGASTSYGYDDTGADPPYAPVSVGGVTLAWDANGNLTERTEGGVSETFAWDAEQRLVSVSGPDGESSFVYDAGGQRLLRRSAEGSTLYFAGQEITASVDGSTVTAVRSYSFAGRLVATRTSAGFQYLVADERGSVEMSAPPLGVPTASRAYEPYGGVQAATGSGLATDRGFLGQVEDGATELSYLNARYYDAASGVFISPDPVYDTGNPKSLNPYTYSQGNPTTLSDPSGLSPSYTLGQETLVASLRQQNSQLMAHIGTLNSHIRELQGVVRQQQNFITRLLTHIEALESVIRQQAAVIRNLQAQVRKLQAQVSYWYGRAMYYRSRAAELANHIFGPAMAQHQMWRIDNGLSIQFEHSRITLLEAQITGDYLGAAWTESARAGRIEDLREQLDLVVSFEGAMAILNYLADDCIASQFMSPGSSCSFYPALAFNVLYAEDRSSAPCVAAAYAGHTSAALDVALGPFSDGVTDPVDLGVAITNQLSDCLP